MRGGTSRSRYRWLVAAAAMTGISFGICFARLLPYEAWIWVGLGAAVVTGVCVMFAVGRES